MTEQEISQAKNPDLRASLAAMRRAAELARVIAMQTNTAIVVVKNGKLERISAEQLRQSSRENFHAVLDAAPNVPPDADDRLPG
jgi:hypothetical protein